MAADIYASQVALAEITCQCCDHRFLVAFSHGTQDMVMAMAAGRARPLDLVEKVRRRCLGYGDPPNIGCCAPGPTMTSDLIAVRGFWRRDDRPDREWRRAPELEIDVAAEIAAALKMSDGGEPGTGSAAGS